MGFTPSRLSASSVPMVAKLRSDYANITLRQSLGTRKTIALLKAFFNQALASDTVNNALKLQA
jgi:hypothetical protein